MYSGQTESQAPVEAPAPAKTSKTPMIMLCVSAVLFVAGGVMLATSLLNNNSDSNANSSNNTSQDTAESEYQTDAGRQDNPIGIADEEATAEFISDVECYGADGEYITNFNPANMTATQCHLDDRKVFLVSIYDWVANSRLDDLYVEFNKDVRQVYVGGYGQGVGDGSAVYMFFVLDDGTVFYNSMRDFADGVYKTDGMHKLSITNVASLVDVSVHSGMAGSGGVAAITKEGEMTSLAEELK